MLDKRVAETQRRLLPAHRQHTCSLRFQASNRSYYLAGIRRVLAGLGPASPGDLLCFQPTGPGAARVELLTGTAQAAEQLEQQEQQPASSGGASSGSSGVDAEPPEWQPAGSEGAASGSSGGSDLEAEPSEDESDADSGGSWGRPAKRQRRRQGGAGGMRTHWSGLEPGESPSEPYAITLPPSAFTREGSKKLHIPGGCQQAANLSAARPALPADVNNMACQELGLRMA